METSRHPLRDLSTNSPSVKRQKLAREGLERQAQHNAQQALPLPEWQKKWKDIMKTTVVYFDLSSAQDFSNRDREAASRLFIGAGAKLAPFFDNNVTIVITKRAKSELPRNMASNENIKVWDYLKVFRFFKNLGEKLPHDRDTHLSAMLQDEKLHGVADRDPSARRDDIYYFKYPFFHVYDIRDIAKPVATREWRQKEKWPLLYSSTCGHSLFQEDPSDTMDERKVRRRKLREEQLAGFRKKLREVYEEDTRGSNIFYSGFTEEGSEDSSIHMHNDSTTNNVLQLQNDTTTMNDITQANTEEEGHDSLPQMAPPPQPQFTRPPVLSRQTSALQNKFIEMTKREHTEIQASGYNGSVSQQSAEYQTRNGLAPTVSTTSSKQLNTLQRKIVKKPTSQTSNQSNNSKKEKVPGYCENCKIHFEDFDEHIVSSKHREFAIDDSNFEAIDELIGQLMQNIRNKQ